MKKLLLKKSVLLMVYTLLNLHFMVFNWKIYSVGLNIDLGFATVKMPPFAVLSLLGFVIIGILTWINYISSLRRIIYELEQGIESGKTKDTMVRHKVREMLSDEGQIKALKDKLGIVDISRKQEELKGIINTLIEKLTGNENLSLTDQKQRDS